MILYCIVTLFLLCCSWRLSISIEIHIYWLWHWVGCFASYFTVTLLSVGHSGDIQFTTIHFQYSHFVLCRWKILYYYLLFIPWQYNPTSGNFPEALAEAGICRYRFVDGIINIWPTYLAWVLMPQRSLVFRAVLTKRQQLSAEHTPLQLWVNERSVISPIKVIKLK